MRGIQQLFGEGPWVTGEQWYANLDAENERRKQGSVPTPMEALMATVRPELKTDYAGELPLTIEADRGYQTGQKTFYRANVFDNQMAAGKLTREQESAIRHLT